ncbi:MAG: D-alanine--D-alanine ligase family protein [Minisyncoccota bacterium]
MNNSSQIRVAVLRGGPSYEYDVSLKTGSEVLRNLPSHYKGIDILIDKDGIWHMNGVPKSPEKIFPHVDIVWNALHGHYGEDGKVQHILETHGVPHTGSPVLPSAFCMNKALAKNIFAKYGIRTPHSTVVHKDEMSSSLVRDIFTTLPHPAIVKPVSSGSSIGVSVVKTIPELVEALEHAFSFGEKVVVEEYITGREATCGVISGFRDENLYALPVLEVKRPAGDSHYSFEHKMEYEASFDHLSLTPLERAEAKRIAMLAHKALGLSHYSRADMIVHPKRGVFLLEVNNQPGLEKTSSFAQGLEHIGSNLSGFLDHVINRTLKII